MRYILPSDKTTSEMFWDSQERSYGGFYVECRCGHQHYAVDSDYRYQYDAEDSTIPEETNEGIFRVHHHGNCDSISYHEFIGQTFVWGCKSCSEYLRKYEDFIWAERETIRNYLKIRVNQEKTWADHEHLMNTLSGIM